MNDNMQKLEEFKKSIACFDRLLLKDAVVLYKELLKEEDPDIKQAKRDYLISGLLYKVHEHIINNGFSRLISSSYDMDDIINSFIERMIKRIDEGILLRANFFGYIFDIDFYNNVFEDISSNRILIFDAFGIHVNIFAELFGEYCRLKMENPNATLNMIFELERVPYFIGQFNNIPYMQRIFDKMIDSMTVDEDFLDFPSDKIKRFAQIMLKNALALELVNVDTVSYNDFEDCILQNIFERDAWNIVGEKCKLNDLQRTVMEKYYREGYSLEEIAEYLNITSNQARGNLAMLFAKVRKTSKVKRYVKDTPLGI